MLNDKLLPHSSTIKPTNFKCLTQNIVPHLAAGNMHNIFALLGRYNSQKIHAHIILWHAYVCRYAFSRIQERIHGKSCGQSKGSIWRCLWGLLSSHIYSEASKSNELNLIQNRQQVHIEKLASSFSTVS